MGLDYSDVLNWEGRSKRVRKPPPVTYWEEFVATDEWYLNELTADVPEDEWKAAVEDDVSDAQTATDPSYSSDDGDESDASDGSDERGDDWTAELVADGDDASDDECSDECSESDASDSEASESDACDSKASSTSDDKAVRPTGKRQRRG